MILCECFCEYVDLSCDFNMARQAWVIIPDMGSEDAPFQFEINKVTAQVLWGIVVSKDKPFHLAVAQAFQVVYLLKQPS